MDSTSGDLPIVEGFTDLVAIGSGGYSAVFSATQVGIGRRVAIKVINVGGDEARRVEREASAMGMLSDLPHVVQIHHVTRTEDGRPALVMTLMPTSMAQRVESGPPVTLDEAGRWLRQVATTLDEAHQRQLFHRDIKPENLLVSERGDAFLADFGIATSPLSAAGTTTSFSLSPPHAPPERLGGGREHAQAGDVYSLGSTIYTAVVGRPPFGTAAEGGVHGLIVRVVEQPLPPSPSLPAPLHAVLATAMAKEPGDRFATAGDLAAAFDRAVATGAGPGSVAPLATVAGQGPSDPAGTGPQGRGPTDPAPAPPPPEEVTTATGRRRGALLAGAAVVIALLVAVGVALWPSAEPERVASDASTTSTVESTDVTTGSTGSSGSSGEPTSTSLPAAVEEPTTPIRPPSSAPAGPPQELDVATATASSVLPAQTTGCDGQEVTYDPSNAVDGERATAWAPTSSDGAGETLTLDLGATVDLEEVGLLPGYAKTAPIGSAGCELRDLFSLNRSVEEVRYHFDDGSTVSQVFSPEAVVQSEPVSVTTRFVTVEIVATRLPSGPDVDDDTLISEVVLVGRP